MATKTRILYVSSEISPFLNTSEIADYVRALPDAMQKKGIEIRVLVPRFGVINERKNRLHEVVRLSGINIPITDDEKPLIIKVASIPSAKMQVYFIDNEDFFHRKAVFKHKKTEEYFEDNDERAIFFCKGVIETVKKLGWAPDIIHCSGWMSGLLPIYVKEAHKNAPLFQDSKVIYTLFKTDFTQKFEGDLAKKAVVRGTNVSMYADLNSGDVNGFVKMGAKYADVVIKGNANADEQFGDIIKDLEATKPVQTIPQSDEFTETYYALYQEMLEAAKQD
jgi:starch synthase